AKWTLGGSGRFTGQPKYNLTSLHAGGKPSTGSSRKCSGDGKGGRAWPYARAGAGLRHHRAAACKLPLAIRRRANSSAWRSIMERKATTTTPDPELSMPLD